MSEDRRLLLDASVVVTLAEVGELSLVTKRAETTVVPKQVRNEVESEPAASQLSNAVESGDIALMEPLWPFLKEAAQHLGRELTDDDLEGSGHLEVEGDCALLALALADGGIVVTDDKPLRQTCKALSIPVSGSLGVVIHAVERDVLDPDEAKEVLYAMDEVGARLSASLVRQAERMIDEAAEE